MLLLMAWGGTWQRLEAEKDLISANARAQQQNMATVIAENLGQLLGRGRLMTIAAKGWFEGQQATASSRLSWMSSADRIFLRTALYDRTHRRVYSSSPAQDSPELQAALRNMLGPTGSQASPYSLAPQLQSNEQAWQIPLLMPVMGHDNTPRGVLMVEFDLGYFLQLYRHIDMGRTGVIQILSPDGVVIAEARQEGLVLQNKGRHAEFVSLATDLVSSVQSDLFQDGRTFLSSVRRPEGQPFLVVVSREMQDILADYSTTRSRFLIVLSIFSIVLLAATYWVVRGLRRQGRFIEAIAQSAQQNRELIGQLEEEKRRAFVLAAHDHLTGLPNRRMFNELLASHLQQAKRNRKHYALMYLDLDRFKSVNDNMGHHIGDLLLQAVSSRLRATLRESDLIARLGGDEFAVLLTALDNVDDAASIAAKLVEQISLPYNDLDGLDIQVSPSIGIAIFPRDGTDAETLYRHADAAMYQSKRWGRGKYTFYDTALNPAGSRFFNLEQRFPKAIAEQELVLHFQPKVRLSDYQIVGFEALVRWEHPELGLIFPNDFIPLAEQTGHIVDIGNWVVEACCQQLCNWKTAGLPLVPIAFNVSAKQLQDEQLHQQISSLLATYDLAADSLEMEITETCLVESMDVAITVLGKLEQLGIRIALDDFGSGFSGLDYIRNFPIHTLKIDRSFINDIRNRTDDAVIVTSIITLAHNLKMNVIAEGVELVDQLIHLKTAGCDMVQGYFFSRPVPVKAASELLKQSFLRPS